MSGVSESAALSPSSLLISSYLRPDYILLGLSIGILIFWAGYWVVHMIAISYGKMKLHKRHPAMTDDESGKNTYPGVSIIKPLVGVDPNLFSNLETFFTLKYPQYEILFCMHNDSDPALMVVDQMRSRYPHVDSRRFTCEERVGINPKINNMMQAYRAAKYDLILISDAGMRMKEDTLTDIVAAMKDNVGIVTQMPFTCDRKGFAATLEKVYFGTAQSRIYLSADAFGVVCSTGMSALYRKNVLDEAGGMQAFSQYIAEDYFFAQAMVARGWKCAISSQPGWQNSGISTVATHHARFARWAKLRIAMLPHIVILEPLQECVLLGILSSLAVNTLFQWNSLVFFLVHVTAWMLTDYVLLSIVQNGPLPFGKFEYVVSWLFREFTSLPLFLRALFNPTISWRTGTYKLKWGGVAVQLQPSKPTSTQSNSNPNSSSNHPKDPKKTSVTIIPVTNSEKDFMHSVYQQQRTYMSNGLSTASSSTNCPAPSSTFDTLISNDCLARTRSELLRI